MTNLPALKAQMGQLSSAFANEQLDDSLGAGIQGGFGRIGYKGKVWSIHHRGEERKLMREDGDGPRNSIEVVILKASSVLAKTYYEGAFVEGSSEAPDCFSSNGVTPDPSSPKPQCTTCGVCPHNQFGSAIRQDGTAGRGKACADAKRLAVVPLADIPNEVFGGPMLLRVPPASLQDLATYDAALRKLGYPYFGVGTRISFDPKDAAPKFVFSPIRALDDAEAAAVVEHRAGPLVDRILSENANANGAPVTSPGIQFEQGAQPAPAPALVAPAPAPAPTPTPTPVAQPKRQTRAKPAAQPPRAPVQQAPVQQAQAPQAAAGGFGAAAPMAATPQSTPEADAGVTPAFMQDLDSKLDELMG